MTIYLCYAASSGEFQGNPFRPVDAWLLTKSGKSDDPCVSPAAHKFKAQRTPPIPSSFYPANLIFQTPISAISACPLNVGDIDLKAQSSVVLHDGFRSPSRSTVSCQHRSLVRPTRLIARLTLLVVIASSTKPQDPHPLNAHRHFSPSPKPPPRAAFGAPPTFSQGFCSRISHWLPSGWRSGGCDGEAPVQRRLQVTSESLADRSDPTDASDCEACCEWHAACDHAKPQPGRNARKAETVPRLVEPTPDGLVRSQPHAAR
ncbi:transcriptional regulator family: Fungal Specific TF [Penicillium hispanicum]|uniref:transcriptional regulator family: Fungal Specific TF n=1 Tax=Penicillium hispanicum TaxID=1080232 RepID=UPI00253FC3E6|nr:transcriptional regulator family: Fungal Specific TF [Penicillium hispanicum]KAJ5585603.1 transcriptional regulator family: Fungal Specific TF [Penicillium hispanicum]